MKMERLQNSYGIARRLWAVDEATLQGDDISTINQIFVYRLDEIASGCALALKSLDLIQLHQHTRRALRVDERILLAIRSDTRLFIDEANIFRF